MDGFVPTHFFGWWLKVRSSHMYELSGTVLIFLEVDISVFLSFSFSLLLLTVYQMIHLVSYVSNFY